MRLNLIGSLLLLFILSPLIKAQEALTLEGSIGISSPFIRGLVGYVDESTGKEYGILGWGREVPGPTESGLPPIILGGLYIIDVDNPTSPTLVSQGGVGRGYSLQVWKNYLYATDRNVKYGQTTIVDISDVENPQLVGTLPSSQVLHIDTDGFLYVGGNGVPLTIYNLNTNPASPEKVWESNDLDSVTSIRVQNEKLFVYQGTQGFSIYDITNHTNPQLLSSVNNTFPRYYGKGWLSSDNRYLYITNVNSEPNLIEQTDNGPIEHTEKIAELTIWDISDPSNPKLVGGMDYPDQMVDDFYPIGNYAFGAYYAAGLRVLDISQRIYPREVAIYDLDPTAGGNIPVGAAYLYPFLPSRNFLVAGFYNSQYNLAIFTTGVSLSRDKEVLPEGILHTVAYPNPFSQSVTIGYELENPSEVIVEVYDLLGRKVETIFEGVSMSGRHEIVWETKQSGAVHPSGTYFYKITTAEHAITRSITLLQ